MIQEKSKLSSWIGGTIAFVLVVVAGLFLYDLFFSKPEHLKGVIIEKIFVPAHTYSGGPYGGNRRGNYTITTAQEEQWIAIVKTESGDTLKVHCHSSHYENTEVGSAIYFKKYEGHMFHVEYFAHNEEEEIKKQ
ncbi:MAG: hypothetical protein ACK5RG_15630 [Cyclobacteriaceae bacterium]|jgi:hypothetical protein|nr:hypothetical protein [Flammeovirgaceae bacterium]